MPTTSKIKMDYDKPQILNYDKDEKCQVDFSTVNPVLKNVLVGDCNNPPTALRYATSSIKDNNFQVFNDIKYKTKPKEIPARRPGLAGYNVKLGTPPCNYKTKNMVEMKKMLEKCGK